MENQGDRIDGKKFMIWVRNLANSNDVVLRILDGKLVSYVEGKTNLHGGVQGTEWPITQNFEGEVSEIETTTPQIIIDESKENQETDLRKINRVKNPRHQRFKIRCLVML